MKMKGFSSFRTEQTLDFRGLDTFVIVGPTGGGKTSILDAMCYALYGWIERVGKETIQFATQGVGRMSVVLDFSVGGAVYRVARTSRTNGPTKILFQTLREGVSYDDVLAAEGAGNGNDDDWTAPDGADRVREANQRIVRALGLTYDSFTRAVLLPQGKFQEFLTGDAKERREILTDLLGLSLFPDMQKVANLWTRDAKAQGDTLAQVVQTEYLDATPEAIAAAKTTIDVARQRDEQARTVVSRVSEIASRHRDASAAAERARATALEARALAVEVREAAEVLAVAVATAEAAEAEVATREAAVASAVAAAEARTDALKAFDAQWGGPAEIAAQIARAESIVTVQARLAELDAQTATAVARRVALTTALTDATAATESARAMLAAKTQERQDALDAWQAATVRDAIGTACKGLHAGDDCPVCGTALAHDPPPPSKEAESATQRGQKVSEELKVAETALKRVEAQLAAAERDLAALTAQETELSANRVRAVADIEATRSALAPSFPDGLPDDPLTALQAARSEHGTLTAAAAAAAGAVTDIERSLAAVRETRATTVASLDGKRARLDGLRGDAVATRARAAGADPVTEPPTGPDLAPWAIDVAAACDAAAERMLTGEGALLEEARTVAGELLPNLAVFVGDLSAFLQALDAVAREASGALAVATEALARAEQRSVRLAELNVEIEQHGARADRFGALARELKGDNIVAFLQAEALKLLSIAATQHLAELSDGRYRLEYGDDDFRVVDTWNADEIRSVKTLSGGETFLASLSLALALSEQVRTLASGARAPLESLFLDEGFGTLDAERLQQVIDAIDRLGGDGRLVGVITHLPELADRMPSRFIVHKAQTGSVVTGPS